MADWKNIAVNTVKVAGAVGTALGGMLDSKAQVSGDPGEVAYSTGDVEWTMDDTGAIFADNAGEEEVNCFYSTCPDPNLSFSKIMTLPPRTLVDATEDLKFYLNGSVCVGPAGTTAEALQADADLTSTIAFAATTLTLGNELQITSGIRLVVDRSSEEGRFQVGITADSPPSNPWNLALKLTNNVGESVEIERELSADSEVSSEDEHTWTLEVPEGIDLEPVVSAQGSMDLDANEYLRATADGRRLARPRN